jgi:hypothetical protein
MKRILVTLLALLLCFGMLVSCGGDTTGTSDTTPTTPTTDTSDTSNNNTENEDPNRVINLVTEGESDYKIVVSKNAKSYEWDAAYNIRLAVMTVTGAVLSVVEDDTTPQDKEIVVGENTNRKSSYTSPIAYADGYSVFTDGERIVIEAGSKEGMKRAIQKFCKDCFNVNIYYENIYKGDEKSELTVLASYAKNESFNSSSFMIQHDDSIIQKRLAYTWMKNFNDILSTKYIIDCDMSANVAENSGDIVVKLVEDGTIAGGAWELHKKSDELYEVHASDYYGFSAASFYFKTYLTKNGIGADGKSRYPESATGTYLDEGFLTRATESARYAYTHTSDIRVMFNNVLWGSPMSGQRDLFNAEMASIYMPDVYGLQEVDLGRRGDKEDGSGGVIAELAKLGYVETIDPRVHNAYPSNQGIPGTNAGPTRGEQYEGQLIPGYGTGGASRVTVGDETFYTYYNCTPLLYNKNTTRYITGAYYWYKNQWDLRVGSTHENGSGDAASKSATWGLFEDIETGVRYIVISTHMCTRSDYVRGLQGAEVVALIDSLIAQYNVPVMFGGDYNGNINSANYKKFVEG